MRNNIRSAVGTIIVATAVAAPALAQNANGGANRRTADSVFTEPRGSRGEQLLYTVGDIIAFQIVRPKLVGADAITDAEKRILTVMKADGADEAKLRGLRTAEIDLAKARLAALQSLQESRAIPMLIKSARVVGATLVLVDFGERAWVWTALRANPTWSPAATELMRIGRGLSTENALPAQ